MLQIHPNARTTPAVRAEIARSGEPSGILAKRYVEPLRVRRRPVGLSHAARAGASS